MPITNNLPCSIFLSYSRKDEVVCKAIFDSLKLQGLDVKIDVNDIPIGENIKDSIAQLITDTDFSIVVISENSLQSTWVIWEIQQREQWAKSKLIPVCLDKSYLDDDKITQITETIQSKIDQLASDATGLNNQSISSVHIDSKKQNLLDLKNNLIEVIGYIRDIKAVDLGTDNFIAGFNKLYLAISGNAELKNSNIISPVIFKNADIGWRINEIESLVAEANIKEAAKRTIDFVNDFYQGVISSRKMAIKISAKAHSGERYLSDGGELMANDEQLVDEILDLIYAPIPNAA